MLFCCYLGKETLTQVGRDGDRPRRKLFCHQEMAQWCCRPRLEVSGGPRENFPYKYFYLVALGLAFSLSRAYEGADRHWRCRQGWLKVRLFQGVFWGKEGRGENSP